MYKLSYYNAKKGFCTVVPELRVSISFIKDLVCFTVLFCFVLSDCYILGAFHRLSHLILTTTSRDKSFSFPFRGKKAEAQEG